jgi:hypothetical protein
MTRPWDAPSALAALLDALETDLLGAPTQDVRAAHAETGRVRESPIHEMRSLLQAVRADECDRGPWASLPDEIDPTRPQRH